jgi:hypothetical protein
VEGSGPNLIEALSRRMPGGTEEKHKPNCNSQSFGRDVLHSLESEEEVISILSP